MKVLKTVFAVVAAVLICFVLYYVALPDGSDTFHRGSQVTRIEYPCPNCGKSLLNESGRYYCDDCGYANK